MSSDWFVVVLLVYVSISNVLAEPNNTLAIECKDKHKVEIEAINEYLKSNKESMPPENVMCFMRCMSMGTHMVNEEGVGNVQIIQELLLKDLGDKDKKKTIDCIKRVPKSSSCRNILRFNECLPPPVFDVIVKNFM